MNSFRILAEFISLKNLIQQVYQLKEDLDTHTSSKEFSGNMTLHSLQSVSLHVSDNEHAN